MIVTETVINVANGLELEYGIKPKEAARFIGCSEYTIKELARQGRVPHYRNGNRIMFTKKGLLKWIELQEKKSWNHV